MADRLPSNTVRKLVNHWGTITQNLQLNDIVGFMISDGTFTKEELAKIKRLPTSRGTEEFLYLLTKKPSRVFNSFLEALRNSNYNDIADIFDESMGLEDNGDDRQAHVFLSEQHHKMYYLQQENEMLRDEIEILMNRFRLVEEGAGKEASAIITTDMAHLARENEELKEEVRELRKKLETSSRKSKSCFLL
ncbi:hypothetical protein CHS0354_030613 [Potamilus streckersoni]|uniref:CARD domain-containing protein n=1 Tax=Potamilus streckersoni TaxID=2493646 RepID=A0AAE0SCF8_9BIVA|nr:hypothetical protein CHS0354_030613 [Potamilus streckersoni]